MTEPAGAAVVLIERGGLVLGVSRKDDHEDFGLPGGKVEPGETLEQAAARELREETGVAVLPAALRRIYEGPGRTPGRTVVAFVADTFEGEPGSREGAAVRWVRWADLCRGSFAPYNRALLAVVVAEAVRKLTPILGQRSVDARRSVSGDFEWTAAKLRRVVDSTLALCDAVDAVIRAEEP